MQTRDDVVDAEDECNAYDAAVYRADVNNWRHGVELSQVFRAERPLVVDESRIAGLDV